MSGIPAEKPDALFAAEHHARPVVIREHGNHALALAADRGYAMQRVPALEDIKGAARQRIDVYVRILAAQQPTDPIVVGIGVAAKLAAVLELSALLRRLDQQR